MSSIIFNLVMLNLGLVLGTYYNIDKLLLGGIHCLLVVIYIILYIIQEVKND